MTRFLRDFAWLAPRSFGERRWWPHKSTPSGFGNSSASMWSDGPVVTRRAPAVPGVDLPDPPAPGAEFAATDGQGRGIPQLLAEIAQFRQERTAWAAEIQRLRNPQPPPPAANLSGAYRIWVQADNRYLHAPGHEAWLLNTKAEVNDDSTRFYVYR